MFFKEEKQETRYLRVRRCLLKSNSNYINNTGCFCSASMVWKESKVPLNQYSILFTEVTKQTILHEWIQYYYIQRLRFISVLGKQERYLLLVHIISDYTSNKPVHFAL